MLRILIISLFLIGTILIFSYLTTYLVQKFGKLIAISSIISVGIILSAIIIAHEDGCVNWSSGVRGRQRFVGLNEEFSRSSSRSFKKAFQKLISINLRKKLKVINK